jgi:hypothetical protein
MTLQADSAQFQLKWLNSETAAANACLCPLQAWWLKVSAQCQYAGDLKFTQRHKPDMLRGLRDLRGKIEIGYLS